MSKPLTQDTCDAIVAYGMRECEGEYVRAYVGDYFVRLDGAFSAEQLRAIADIMVPPPVEVSP